MRPARPVFLSLLAGPVAFLLIFWSGAAWPQHAHSIFILCAASYGSFLLLDMRSTIMRGRLAVGIYETAVPFKKITGRWGFRVSVPVQIALEISLAAVIIPYYIAMTLDVPTIFAVLGAFAAYHGTGWIHNTMNARARRAHTV